MSGRSGHFEKSNTSKIKNDIPSLLQTLKLLLLYNQATTSQKGDLPFLDLRLNYFCAHLWQNLWQNLSLLSFRRKRGSRTVGMSQTCGGWLCLVRPPAVWLLTEVVPVSFVFFFCYLLWRFDNYSVHSSVTVTIVTRYFFILHNQQCHGGGWVGLVGMGL